MLRSLKLVGVGPAPEMEMQFASRLNVLTGDNGLGKSLFLEAIWYVLTGNWAGEQAYPNGDLDGARIKYEIHQNHIEEAGFAKLENRWHRAPDQSDNLIIYARVDGSVSIWDPLRFSERAGRGGTIFQFEADEILNGTKSPYGTVICRGLIEDWVTWQEKRPETPRGQVFTHLKEILKLVSPNPERERIRPVDPVRMLGDGRTFPTIDTGYGPIRIVHASAAMKRIISLAYLITWAWHEHVEEARQLKEKPAKNLVFLMDEVETHLHPEWQRRILPALLKVLESLGEGMQVQMHVTTHSPMVLASLEPHWDNAKDKLFHFALKDGKVTLASEELITRGDATRWLTSHVFGLNWARSVEAERALEDARAFMQGEAPKYFKTPEEVDAQLRHTLPGQDPFWPRWLIYTGDADK